MVGKQSRTSSTMQSPYLLPILIGREPGFGAGLEGLLPELVVGPVGLHAQGIQRDALVVL